MPWKPSDADNHIKGLDEAQKKTWASTANRILRKCQESSGEDCEGKAIRIANETAKSK